jgi:PAS domain S-box-containing protein
LPALPQSLTRLVGVMHDLARAESLDDIQSVIRTSARTTVGADGIALILRENGQVRYVEEDAIGPLWKGQRFPLSGCISGVAIRSGQPVVVEDIATDPRIPQQAYVGTFVRSLVMVPIRSEAPLGAIGAYWAEHHHPTPSEVEILAAMADAGAVAVANVRLLERERAERALADGLIGSLPGLFYLTDDLGRILRWNHNLQRFTGLAPEQLRHRMHTRVYDPSDRAQVEELVRRARSEGHGTVEARFAAQGGALPVPHYVTAARVEMRGQPALLVVALDLSERVALEEQLRHAQKLEALGRLAGGVSHDFNNLLTVVRTNAQLGMLRSRRGQDVLEPLDQIEQASQRAAELTRQLLAFGRAQSFDESVLDIGDVIVNLLPLLRRVAGERVQVETELDPGTPAIVADRTRIEQVVLNLVLNGADAMNDGGALTVRSFGCVLDDGHVHLHAEAHEGPHAVIEVSDTGHGIDPQWADRIFEPFFTTKGDDRGTGLGLSIVYGIVRQHGGHVTVDSVVGQGSTFRVYLPASTEAPKPRPTREPARPLEASGETILVAEDDAAVRQVVVQSLESSGYRVLAASSGPEALALSRRHRGPIHVLLADIVMPGMLGHELFRRMEAERPGVRVLYMSGFAEPSLRDEVCRHGAILDKPFSLEQLWQALGRVMDDFRRG